MGANRPVINKFFDLYQETLDTLDIDSPGQIWNIDESGLSNVPEENIVVGEVGVKAHRQVGLERGQLTTVLTMMNGVGKTCPPMIIHKGTRVQEGWLTNCPHGTLVRASQKGWVNAELFYEYALRFVRFMRTNKLHDRPNLLILDGHKSHVYNLHFLQLMLHSHIQVLTIPPPPHIPCPAATRPGSIRNYEKVLGDGTYNPLHAVLWVGTCKVGVFLFIQQSLAKEYDCSHGPGRL